MEPETGVCVRGEECVRCMFGERISLAHLFDIPCFIAIAIRAVSQALFSVIKVHHLEIAGQVAPLNSVKSIEEIMQAGVMKDHNPGVTPRNLPDGAMKYWIVADVVDACVGAIQLFPRHAVGIERANIGEF